MEISRRRQLLISILGVSKDNDKAQCSRQGDKKHREISTLAKWETQKEMMKFTKTEGQNGSVPA
jgi:hypothetical protein